MVKINTKILSYLVVFVMLISVAHATLNLEFSNVDVKVGSKSSKNLNDGNTISQDAEPGDVIQLKIEVRNNYTSAENLEIQDITVEGILEGVDDGDDLDEESSEFDLSPGRDKTITLKFQLPMEIDEDTYTIQITADGDDENGTSHLIQMKLNLDVEKYNHNLMFTKNSIIPDTVSCSRKNVKASVGVLNIGNDDEEDVELHITNSDLGLNIEETIPEIIAEANEPESMFSKTYAFNVPTDVEAGVYPVTFSVLYNNGHKKTEGNVDLTVNDCAVKTAAVSKPATTTTSNNEVEILVPQGSQKATATTADEEETVPSDTTVTQESFARSNTFVISIIAGIAVVVVGIVLLIVFLVRG